MLLYFKVNKTGLQPVSRIFGTGIGSFDRGKSENSLGLKLGQQTKSWNFVFDSNNFELEELFGVFESPNLKQFFKIS